ncbi:hypothetical protein Tco_1554471 [Tanacetum coccineum]
MKWSCHGSLCNHSGLAPSLMILEQSVQDSYHNLLLQHLMFHQQRMTGIRYFALCLMSTSILSTSVSCVSRLDVQPGTSFINENYQDTPSTSTSQTTQEAQSHVIPTSVEEDDHGIEVAHMDNDP